MIEANNISVCYRISCDRILSMKEFLLKKLQRKVKYEEFWALKDVSFQIAQGEVLGIIGHNGAGKSTLLKVVAGILKPSEGSISVVGTIAPLLELGSGFDFDLTGRENIFLNGAILGYSEQFLTEKFDEIVEFSEIGKFIDMPIRNYSSGMLTRLAFSIATIVKPEILIVDEVLSVGDADFQVKSRNRMLKLMGEGTTVLFVSHDIEQVKELCSKVLWIEHGQLQEFGDPQTVCAHYSGEIISE